MKIIKSVLITALIGSSLYGSKDSCTIELTAKLAQDILDNTNIILPKICIIEKDVIKILINQESIADLLCSKLDSISISTADVQVSGIDILEQELLSIGDVLCSKIEGIDLNITATVDLSPVLDAIDSLGDVLCSKIDGIDLNITATVDLAPAIAATDSVGDVLCSKLEIIMESQVDILNDLTDISTKADVILEKVCEDIPSQLDIIESKIDGQSSSFDSIIVQVSLVDADLCSKIGNLDEAGSCLETIIDVPDDINNLNLTIIQLLKTILLELRGCNQ